MHTHDEAFQRHADTYAWSRSRDSSRLFAIPDEATRKDMHALRSSFEHQEMMYISEHASTYSLDGDIANAIWTASEGIPMNAQLHSSDAPEECGFVWCSSPLKVPAYGVEDLVEGGSDPIPLSIHGFGWHLLHNVQSYDGDPVSGAFILFLVRSEDVLQNVLRVPAQYSKHAVWSYSIFMRFGDTLQIMLERSLRNNVTYGLGREWETDQNAIMRQKFVLAFWSFLRLKIMITERDYAHRHVARRVARQGIPVSPEVNVVILRKTERVAEEIEHHTIEWTCRWLVSGHWRNQNYPSRGRHELIWIEPYMKGPDDKPLKPKPAKLVKVVR